LLPMGVISGGNLKVGVHRREQVFVVGNRCSSSGTGVRRWNGCSSLEQGRVIVGAGVRWRNWVFVARTLVRYCTVENSPLATQNLILVRLFLAHSLTPVFAIILPPSVM
jgi:hypothetical protein